MAQHLALASSGCLGFRPYESIPQCFTSDSHVEDLYPTSASTLGILACLISSCVFLLTSLFLPGGREINALFFSVAGNAFGRGSRTLLVHQRTLYSPT